jgi:uncharacterized protein (TIGR02231 family)
MKAKLLFPLIFVFCSTAFAVEEQHEIEVKSEIKQAIVYLTGAELLHDSKVTVKKGKNLIKFKGLSSKLDPKSIVVDVENKSIVILSVYSSNNFLEPVLDNPKIKPVKDSLEKVMDEIAMLNGLKDALTQEKNLMFKNDAIFGKEKGIPVLEVEKSADFFRKRTVDINKELYFNDKKQANLNKLADRLNKQLKELNATINPPSSEVSVLVLASDGISSNFELKYRVSDAGWAPKYDIRVDNITKPLSLYYKANVFNNTGMDWVNVKLKLSTASPLQGAQHPDLETWKMDEQIQQLKGVTLSNVEIVPSTDYQKQQLNDLKKGNKDVNFKLIEVDELSAEFDIPQPYSIPSDSKPYLVDVSFKALDAKYEHLTIPKMDKDAFLVAKVTGWNEMNLVSGDASVYFNGTYIGQSKIDTRDIYDTLELSLGRDNKVFVSRIKKSEVNDHQFLGNYEKELFKYEIIVKNNREIPITIVVEDQVPVENDTRVDVDINELSGGNYNKGNGDVTWKLTLAPGETKKLVFDFSVRYPKGFKPKKKKFRTISAPSF